MAMNGQPNQDAEPPNPPPVPAAPPRTPLVDRVADLEHRLAALTDLHNRFVEAATRELGI